MPKLSFVQFEKKVKDDIETIMLEQSFETVIYQNSIFREKNHENSYDTIFFAFSSDVNARKIIFNVGGARKLNAIDKYLEPYLPLLLNHYPLNGKDDPIKFTFSTKGTLRKSTNTDLYADDYNYNKLKKVILSFLSLIKAELDSMSINIYVMDKLANGGPLDQTLINPRIGGAGMYYHKMIIAKLAGNKQYEVIYKYFIQLMEADIAKQTKYSEKSKVHFKIANMLHNDLESIEPIGDGKLV